MNEVEAQAELTRMFFAFAGGIAFFIAIYLFRSIRIYLFGRRVAAVVVRVLTQQLERKRPMFGYLIEYRDPASGSTKTAREPPALSFQEFRAGDRVTAFVNRQGDVAEILSWKRLALTSIIIALVGLAMFISYQYLLGAKKT